MITNNQEANADQISQVLKEHMVQIAEYINTQHTRISELESRLGSLGLVTDQILQTFQSKFANSPQPDAEHRSRITEVETRIQTLDEKTDQVLQTLQSLQQTLQQTTSTLVPSSTRKRGPSTKRNAETSVELSGE